MGSGFLSIIFFGEGLCCANFYFYVNFLLYWAKIIEGEKSFVSYEKMCVCITIKFVHSMTEVRPISVTDMEFAAYHNVRRYESEYNNVSNHS